MADLSYIIDPGGVPGGRPGINVQVFASGNEPTTWQPLGPDTERLVNANLSAGGFNELMEFSWTSVVNESVYNKLRALSTAIQTAKSASQQWEVVVYNLAEQFNEISNTGRSRFRVPTTPIEQTSLGSGWIQWKYWVAVQGNLIIQPRRVGSLYEVNFEFQEGLKLVPSMEV